jgi:ATP/maltotriose-dependent transcriptional regulator MalT
MGERAKLSAGSEALARADWPAAEAAFETELRNGPSGDALAGFARAMWFRGDPDRAIDYYEQAYAELRREGDDRRAARMAMFVALEHVTVRGNPAAAAGWLARAESLLVEAGPCAERGWLGLRKLGKNPLQWEQTAREAIALARVHGDPDLEFVALSQLGRARVMLGSPDEGFKMLDEAMAAATSGDVQQCEAVGEICCNMVTTCEEVLDIERAEEWCRITDGIAQRVKFATLYAYCCASYSTVLIATGRWSEAETQLQQALAVYEVNHRPMRLFALGRLAYLRLLQGRLDEAAQLLAGHEDHYLTVRFGVMLFLAKGEPARAATLAETRLAVLGPDSPLGAQLLAMLVEALLALDDVTAARAAADRLEKVATSSGRAAIAGGAALAAARVALAAGEPSAAQAATRARDHYQQAQMPLEAARARLALAQALPQAPALDEARGALAEFERLGATRDADAAAALLRRLGKGGRTGPRLTTLLSKRENEVLALLPLGLSNAELGARLFISPKTVEHHIAHICEKLGLKNRAAAAAYAVRVATK